MFKHRLTNLAAAIIAVMLTSCSTTAPPEPIESITLVNDCAAAYADTCPAYRMTIFSDDTYLYESRQRMKYIGQFRGKKKSGTFLRAKASLEGNGYWKLSEDYYAAPSIDCDQLSHYRYVAVSTYIDSESRDFYHQLPCKGFAEENQLLLIESELEAQLGVTEWVVGD